MIDIREYFMRLEAEAYARRMAELVVDWLDAHPEFHISQIELLTVTNGIESLTYVQPKQQR